MNRIPSGEKIKKDTRVLLYIKESKEYIMTNDSADRMGHLRVFLAYRDGTITYENCSLGSFLAHNPYMCSETEEPNCTFEELNPEYFNRNPVVDGLIGLAVGDALGVPFEFLSRNEVRRINIEKLLDQGDETAIDSYWGYQIPFGAWSDDTSMAVAAMHSIVNNRGTIDYDDVMKQFILWWDNGKYSSLDYSFGLGNNISQALENYRNGVPALKCGGNGFHDNGNGALMRIFPFSVYCILSGYSDDKTLEVISNSAKITHAHEINLLCCYLYTLFLRECIRTRNPRYSYHYVFDCWTSKYKELFSENTLNALSVLFEINRYNFNPDCINESGYVVDSLAVAVYSLLRTDNYEDAVKTAIRFGYDTDTDAAITGSVAGAIYGINSIPERWLNKLKKKKELIELGNTFSQLIK